MIVTFKSLCGSLMDAWLQYPRDIKAICSFPQGPPVLITGPVRSGTTWFAAMLGLPGVWYLHEPFFPGKGFFPRSYLYARPGEADSRVDAVMKRILGGGARGALGVSNAWHPLMPLRVLPPPDGFRLMIKDPTACLLADYLTRRYAFRTFVLFRHPVAVASSVERLGWPTGSFLQEFLKDRNLMEDHLSPCEETIRAHAGRNDLMSAAALCACLYRVLWRASAANSRMTPLIFEELCMAPVERFAAICRDIGFPYDDQARARHEELTGTATGKDGYRTHEVRRNSAEMITGWRARVDSASVAGVRRVWEEFEVPFYTEPLHW